MIDINIKELSDDELAQKLYDANSLINRITHEQKRRNDIIRREKYKNIIEKYFYCVVETETYIYKIIDVKDDSQYVCNLFTCSSNFGKQLLQTNHIISFHIMNNIVITNLNDLEEIREEKANEIINKCKEDVKYIHL